MIEHGTVTLPANCLDALVNKDYTQQGWDAFDGLLDTIKELNAVYKVTAYSEVFTTKDHTFGYEFDVRNYTLERLI